MEKQRLSQPKKMSDSQQMRGAFHLYLSQVVNEANNKGLTMNQMIKIIKHLEARPNILTLKEMFVKPFIKENFHIDSTNKMTAAQVTETYDALNLAFGYHFDIHFPFPNKDDQSFLETYIT